MATVFKLTSGASLNETQIGGTGAALRGWYIYNTNAAARFVKFWWGAPGTFSSNGDKPVVGTDPPQLTIQIPATGKDTQALNVPTGNGKNMFMATTTGAADTDNTAVGSGDLIISVYFD